MSLAPRRVRGRAAVGSTVFRRALG